MFRKVGNIFNKDSGQQATGQDTSRVPDVRLSQTQEETEGFLCPICMIRCETPEHLQKHFDAEHSEPEVPAQHFTCPVCKNSFSTAETLQSHYKLKHENDRNGNIGDEGRPHTGYSKPQTSSNATALLTESTEERAELDMATLQLKASEESRMLMSSELYQCQKELKQSEERLKAMKSEKDAIEQKAGKMASDIVSVKARADEIDSQKTALEDHIQTLKLQLQERSSVVQKLEAQLNQRPGSDDVTVLQQELANSQTLMDMMMQERDKDKESLEKELTEIREKHKQAKQKIQELQDQVTTVPRDEEINRLQAHVASLEKEAALKERDETTAKLTQTVNEAETQLCIYQTRITELEQCIALLEKRCSDHDQQLVLEKNKMEEEHNVAIKEKDDRIEALQKKLSEKKIALREKETSLSASEMKEKDVEKALSEIKMVFEERTRELGSAQEELTALRRRLHNLDEELSAANEELAVKSQLLSNSSSEMQTMLESAHENVKTLTETTTAQTIKISELTTDLDTCRLSLSQNEEVVKDQEELLLHTRAELQKKDEKVKVLSESIEKLESQLAETQQMLQDSANNRQAETIALQAKLHTAEVTAEEVKSTSENLHQQLLEREENNQSQLGLIEDLRIQLRETSGRLELESRQSEQRLARTAELESELNESLETFKKLESERAELMLKIEAGDGANMAINQLRQENTSLQEQLAGVKLSSHEQQLQQQQAANELHRQLQELRSQLDESREKLARQESVVSEKTEKLEELQTRLSQAENEAKTKVAQLLDADVNRKSLQADMDNQLQGTKQMLADKTKELAKVRESMDELVLSVEEHKLRVEKLDDNVKVLTEKNKDQKQRNVSLEAELKEKVILIDKLQMSTANFQATFEGQLNNLQKELAEKENSFTSAKAKLKESRLNAKNLEDSVRDLTAQLQTSQSNVNKLQEQITLKNEEIRTMETDGAAVKQRLADTCEDFTEKASQLEAIQSTMEAELSRLKLEYDASKEQAAALQQQLTNQIESEEQDRVRLLAEISESETKLMAANNKLAVASKQIDELQTSLTAEREAARQIATEHSSKLDESLQNIENLKEELACYKRDQLAKSEMELHLNTKVKELGHERDILASKVNGLEQDLTTLQTRLRHADETHASALTVAAKREQVLSDKLSDQENIAQTLSKSLQAESDCVSKLKTEIENLKQQYTGQLDVEKHNVVDLTNKLKTTEEERKAIADQVNQLRSNLEEDSSTINRLQTEKVSLGDSLATLKKEHQQLSTLHTELDKEMSSVQLQLCNERDARAADVAEGQAARQLLTQQKLQLAADVEAGKKELEKVKTEFEQEKHAFAQELEQLHSENAQLQKQLSTEVERRQQLQRQHDESVTRHQLEIGALTENLATLRSEMSISNQKLVDLDKSTNQHVLEKLELEAKLQNNNDERRVLLERCLASEAECTKINKLLTESRRKLEDTQAALQELGRENQSLQISNNQAQSRRWAIDNEAVACTACDKPFSVTVRKHHCRNCGEIFCNECSLKKSAVAASKKPVRVCEDCYKELSTR